MGKKLRARGKKVAEALVRLLIGPFVALMMLSNSGAFGGPVKPLNWRTRVLLVLLPVAPPASFAGAWFGVSAVGLRPPGRVGTVGTGIVSALVMFLVWFYGVLAVCLTDLKYR